MFSDRDLRELVNYQAQSKMLSIYLNTDPPLGNADSYRLRLRSMMKNTDLKDDVERIESYFDTEYDWSGRSVVLFSDASADFFRVYPLAIPTPDLIHEGIRPNVRPLAGLIDSFGGYGVVLVDKQGARIFHFHLGELREQDGVLGNDINKIKTGSSSLGKRGGSNNQSHSIEETIERNMRESVDFATAFFETKHIRRILLGGSDDNIALFRSYLPKSWQSLIAGSFVIPMTASSHEVAQRAMEIGVKAEEVRETQVVERLITQAAKNSHAVTGMESALAAVSAGRVQTLVIQHSFQTAGFYCPDCKVITSQPDLACRACESIPQEVQDVIALAVTFTLEYGGEVEVVKMSPNFEDAGKIGAFLRY
ncbi:MAG: hypothetical protein BGO78_07070 [Chloroflexi bacterium 44-23]|nr:MAG: hypothetical protein BGO78_07070 [Chloroflexi bacterium 44-23]